MNEFSFVLNQCINVLIYIDKLSNWKEHVANLCKNLCKKLRRLKECLPIRSLIIMVYHAYFHSLLSYGILHWGNSTNANRAFIIQKRAIRILANIKSQVSCKKYFKEFQILPLPSVYILETVKFSKKNPHLVVPNNFNHQYHTRNKSLYRTDKHKKH